MTSHLLFDFFGTLVSYSPQRCDREYTRTRAALGAQADQAVFVGDTHSADFIGPERAGIKSFLIDPHNRAGVPAQRRLDTVFELSTRLA